MFIVDCIPLSKSFRKDSLSYFSAKNIETGSLVKISLRNKMVTAIVIGSRSAVEAKSEIKSADFQLKKIEVVVARPFFDRHFLSSVEKTSEYFAYSAGSIISHIIPSLVINNPNILFSAKEPVVRLEPSDRKKIEPAAI